MKNNIALKPLVSFFSAAALSCALVAPVLAAKSNIRKVSATAPAQKPSGVTPHIKIDSSKQNQLCITPKGNIGVYLYGDIADMNPEALSAVAADSMEQALRPDFMLGDEFRDATIILQEAVDGEAKLPCDDMAFTTVVPWPPQEATLPWSRVNAVKESTTQQPQYPVPAASSASATGVKPVGTVVVPVKSTPSAVVPAPQEPSRVFPREIR